MKHILSLVFTSIFVFSTGALRAENWPQFRGPGHQGHSSETGLPLKWSATENIAWKTPLPGQAWSSPIVWNERVFVTTATENGESCRVLALDRASGKIVWDKEVFRQTLLRKEERNTYASPTPATDGERVYACFGDGSFAALNFDGETVWTNRDYKYYSQHGLASSPILHGGTLIMARDGSSDGADKRVGWQTPWDQSYIVALEAKTGKQLWKAKRGMSRIAHGAPAIWTHDGKTEVVGEAGDVLQGHDAQSGELLWTSKVQGEAKVPSVVLGEGLVFTAGGWGGRDSIKAFKLGGSGDLQETNRVWEQKKGTPKVPSMLYLKPHLYAIADNGMASCLKAGTGEPVWQEPLSGKFSASLVAGGAGAGGERRIYILNDNGDTTVIEAGDKLKVLAENPLGEKVQASMALAHGHIFIRTEKHLICIGAK